MYRLGVMIVLGLFLNAALTLANLLFRPTPVYAEGPQPVTIVGCNLAPATGSLPVVIRGWYPLSNGACPIPVKIDGQLQPIETRDPSTCLVPSVPPFSGNAGKSASPHPSGKKPKT